MLPFLLFIGLFLQGLFFCVLPGHTSRCTFLLPEAAFSQQISCAAPNPKHLTFCSDEVDYLIQDQGKFEVKKLDQDAELAFLAESTEKRCRFYASKASETLCLCQVYVSTNIESDTSLRFTNAPAFSPFVHHTGRMRTQLSPHCAASTAGMGKTAWYLSKTPF